MDVRTIKFRVWDEKTRRFHIIDPTMRMVAEAFEPILLTLDGLMFLLEDGARLERNWHLKKPRLILQQFTGVTDKNDNEIYEGDILILPGDSNPEAGDGNDLVVMEWRGNGWGYRDIDNKNKWCSLYDLIGVGDHDDEAEVVGNVCENADWLK